MRLNLFLARSAGGSRREADTWIRAGRVRVNGLMPGGMGQAVDPARDVVTLDDRILSLPTQPRYVAYHKPPGLLVSRRGQGGRSTVVQALENRLGPAARGLQPIGRLDLDSEGLLLFTDDGSLAEALLHPITGLTRRYRVWVAPVPTAAAVRAIRAGARTAGGSMVPSRVLLEGVDGKTGILRVDLTEGKKREVRRLAQHAGLRVVRLVRIAFGPVQLGTLGAGESRSLTDREIAALRRESLRFDRGRITRARVRSVLHSRPTRGATQRRRQ